MTAFIGRREFIARSAVVAAWPLAAHAQQAAIPVISMLLSGSRASQDLTLRAFHQGLVEIGYVEGRNVAVEYRWAEDTRTQRFPHPRPNWCSAAWA